jgi:putative flippase GtrA
MVKMLELSTNAIKRELSMLTRFYLNKIETFKESDMDEPLDIVEKVRKFLLNFFQFGTFSKETFQFPYNLDYLTHICMIIINC